MKKIVLLFIVLFSVAIVLLSDKELKPEVLGIPKVSEKSDIESSLNELSVCGWIPWWNYDKALSELTHYDHSISIVSPFVFTLENNGTITQHIASERLVFPEFSVIPTISNSSNADTVSEILNNPELSNLHRSEIVKLVKSNNFDGIEIDYERLHPTDKEAFTTFIRLLSEKLHEIDALLSVTIDPHQNQSDSYQDWEQLSIHADYLRIMAYDYKWSATTPGPIAPISWIRDITTRALIIPREKRILGIGLYGYEWDTKGSVRARSLNEIEEIINTGTTVEMDKTTKAPLIRSKSYEIWFENRESLEEKLQIANENYSGVCIWSLGDLPEEMYSIEMI